MVTFAGFRLCCCLLAAAGFPVVVAAGGRRAWTLEADAEPPLLAGGHADSPRDRAAPLAEAAADLPLPAGGRAEGPRARAAALAELHAAEQQLEDFDHQGHELEGAGAMPWHGSKGEKEAAGRHAQLDSVEDELKRIHKLETQGDEDGQGPVVVAAKAVVQEKAVAQDNATADSPTERFVDEEIVKLVTMLVHIFLFATLAWCATYVLVCVIGGVVVYYLHSAKYRPTHGCATVLCCLQCFPCGLLALCMPIDEATPELENEREATARAPEEEVVMGKEEPAAVLSQALEPSVPEHKPVTEPAFQHKPVTEPASHGSD